MLRDALLSNQLLHDRSPRDLGKTACLALAPLNPSTVLTRASARLRKPILVILTDLAPSFGADCDCMSVPNTTRQDVGHAQHGETVLPGRVYYQLPTPRGLPFLSWPR